MWILQRLFTKMMRISLWKITLIVLTVILLSSLIIKTLEPETFPRYLDAVWWTMTTVVTVGYGDYSPSSDIGRIFTMILLYTVGIGAMGIIIGKIFDSLALYKKMKEEGKLAYKGKDHYILIGSSKDKLINVVEEILNSNKNCDIVIVDHSNESPVQHERVHFVSGNPAEEEVLMQANILESKSVAVFTDDRIELPEYADGKTLLIASRVEHISKQSGKNIYTIAEIMKEKHIALFEHANVDEFILANESVSKLMAQAAIFPGSSKLFKQLLSNMEGENLYEVEKKPHWGTYKQAAMELFDLGATLISDGHALDVARKHNEPIPDGAKMFVICDEDTFKKISS
ncbi:potassium channel protein [Bacillus sp. ISL-35]|uniref:potassium channel family protein n=1 Tax=Bacillus sp. ISL-35 TaxID=2819122 RepID=UPI001BE72C96|nr:potassium channel family protein [Bacillus sp. ISL-35]MBT2680998.1 potassium channel protein [Bacillus sp. ISL-35]MBT2705317.1 potassium channel protein [Chryseobacterium sp. ISL-80]